MCIAVIPRARPPRATRRFDSVAGAPFPPRQPASFCKTTRPDGRPDATKDVLERIAIAPPVPPAAPGAPPRPAGGLMCIIYTIEKSHATAARGVRDTWASRCDGWVTMSTATDADIPAVNIPHEGVEEYNNIWQKVPRRIDLDRGSGSNERDGARCDRAPLCKNHRRDATRCEMSD